MSDWLDLPYREAVRYLRGLTSMTREDFDSLVAEARAQAFTVSRVSKLEAIQGVLDELSAEIESGGSIEAFAEKVDELGLGLSDAHVETVFRTNVQSAFGRGSFERLSDPDLADVVWGWRYLTVGDDLVRPEHEALEGAVFALGEGDEFFPPIDFNCRCYTESVTQAEAEEEGLESSDVTAEMRDALDTEFASPALGVDYRPDLSGYHPSLLAAFAADQEANQ